MDRRQHLYFLCVLFSALGIGGLGAAVRPVVTFTPNWSKIIYQDPVTITCDVGSAAPEKQRYRWYKDGKLLRDNGRQSFRIDYVEEEDVGAYQCGTSTSDLSPPVTLNATLDYLILQRPPFIYEGDPLILRCHSAYGYEGTNTTFYKEDKEIKFSVSDSEFHLDTVDGGSSGIYRCTKLLLHHSDHTHHNYSAETYISVLGKVKENVEPRADVSIIAGATVGGMAVVLIIFFSILLWKCKNKTTLQPAHKDQQTMSAPMEVAGRPHDPEDDICYLSMDHLQKASSTSASKSVDMSTTYAEVKLRPH
ncbi:low affinity immunoglobulin gamma Fc region receptor III-A-like [Dendropsophus ebraccatus]|uniref:low affinity immunoglobulin gamma Fc region receptor III-A-like n=1 Tax=Dendropsophus ebraccatus TaxID=150705 RepID=UPI0038312026